MDDTFYRHILRKQQEVEAVPPNEIIASWAVKVLRLLYPEKSKRQYGSVDEIRSEFAALEHALTGILNDTKACCNCNNDLVARQFFEQVPALYALLNKDAQAIMEGDPAARSEFEVI